MLGQVLATSRIERLANNSMQRLAVAALGSTLPFATSQNTDLCAAELTVVSRGSTKELALVSQITLRFRPMKPNPVN